MYRYQGNTGRYVWVPDTPSQSPTPRPSAPRPAQNPPPGRGAGRGNGRGRNSERQEPGRPDASPLFDLGGSLSNILSGVFPDGFEMEDALLLLVLFLMYKETGDKDLLIIMGAMFLL